jgi:hypothetical protein
VLPVTVSAQAADSRLMTDAEYRSLLNHVSSKLPLWEDAFKAINPAKSDVSCELGEKIVQNRDLGLREIGWVRKWIEKQRIRRTVSGELALRGFLQGVYDAIDIVVSLEVAGQVTLSTLEKYAPEIGGLIIPISNDVSARVELLEKGTCP